MNYDVALRLEKKVKAERSKLFHCKTSKFLRLTFN